MKITIYGATTCAACKNVLSLAQAKGLEVDYRLIDGEDEGVYQEFVQVTGSARANMPVCVAEFACEQVVTQGLADGVALVQRAQEVGYEG